MRRKQLYILFIFIIPSEILYGQWTVNDSLWLDSLLSGEEEIILKPEIKKAIELRTLLNTDNGVPELYIEPSKLNITRNLIDETFKDDESQIIDYKNIPPTVYLRYYGPKSNPPINLRSFVMTEEDKKNLYLNNYKPNFSTDPLNNKIMYPAEISLSTLKYLWDLLKPK
jgi:hypothetical protein